MQCKKHRTYKAIRKPRAECTACWEMWNEAHKVEVAKDEAEMEETLKKLIDLGLVAIVDRTRPIENIQIDIIIGNPNKTDE